MPFLVSGSSSGQSQGGEFQGGQYVPVPVEGQDPHEHQGPSGTPVNGPHGSGYQPGAHIPSRAYS